MFLLFPHHPLALQKGGCPVGLPYRFDTFGHRNPAQKTSRGSRSMRPVSAIACRPWSHALTGAVAGIAARQRFVVARNFTLLSGSVLLFAMAPTSLNPWT